MEREIREFYEKVSRDEDFKKSILLAKEKYSEEKDTLIQLKKIINDVIIPFSKKYGYDFDIEDLLNFERSTNEKNSKLIDEANLENVSGGFSPRINAICLTALLGISSFSGFASNNVASAENPSETSNLIMFSSPEEDLTQELENLKTALDFCQKNSSAKVGKIREVLKKGLPKNSNLISLTAANPDELISQLYNQQEIKEKQRLELLAANPELDLSNEIKEAKKAILSNFVYTHQSDSDSAELLKNIKSDTTLSTLAQQVNEITQEIANVQNWLKAASDKKSSQQRTIARNMLKKRRCNWEGNTTGEKEGVLVPPAEFINNLETRKNLLESLRNKLLEIEQLPQKMAEKRQSELNEQIRIQKEEAERQAKEEAERVTKEEAERLVREKAEQERSVQEVIEINKRAKKGRREEEKMQRQEQAKREQNKIKLEISEPQISYSDNFKDMFEISNSIINDIKTKAEEKINNLQTVEDCQKEMVKINSNKTLIGSTKESLINLLNLRINYLSQIESIRTQIKSLQTSSECQKKIDEINKITELNQNDRLSLIKSLVHKKARFANEEKAKLEQERLAKEEAERIAREKAEQERIEKERLERERIEKERLEKERLENERLEREKIKVQKYINNVISEKYKVYKDKKEKLSALQKDFNNMDSRLNAANSEQGKNQKLNAARNEARKWFSEHQIQWGGNTDQQAVNYLTIYQAKTAYTQAIANLTREINEEERQQQEILKQQEKVEKERLESERRAKEKAEYEAVVPFHANLTNVKIENDSLILEIDNNIKTIEISSDIIDAIMKHNNIRNFSPINIDFHLENADGFKVLRKDGYFGSLRCFNENENKYSSISLPTSDRSNILIVTSDGYIRATDLAGKELDEVTITKTDIRNIQQTYPKFEENYGLKLNGNLSKLNIKIDAKNTLYKDKQDKNVHLVSGDNTDPDIVKFLGGQLSVEPKSHPIPSNEIISEETQATDDSNEITSNPGFLSRMFSKIKSFFPHDE